MYNDPSLKEVLQKGGLVVMPTDTIYGVVARAQDKKASKRYLFGAEMLRNLL